MAVLRPFDKLPTLNSGILLVGPAVAPLRGLAPPSLSRPFPVPLPGAAPLRARARVGPCPRAPGPARGLAVRGRYANARAVADRALASGAARGPGRGAAAAAVGDHPGGEEGLQHWHVSDGRGPCHLLREVQAVSGTAIPVAPKLVKSAGSAPVAGVGAVERTVRRETSLLRTLESTTAQM